MQQKLFGTAMQSNLRHKRKVFWVRTTTLLLAFIATILLVFLNSAVFAQSEKVAIEVVPSLVELLPTGEKVQVLVVIHNPTTKTLRNVQLSWLSDTRIVPTNDIPTVKMLVPNGEFAWRLLLSQPPGELVSGNGYLRINYTWQQTEKADEIPGVLLSSLQLKSRELSTTEKILSVEVKANLESLNENHPSVAYLVMTNKSNGNIEVKKVWPLKPSFIFICFPQDKCTQECKTDNIPVTFKLSPHQTRVIPIKITASDSVQPGKHLLVFKVDFKWSEAGNQLGNIVVTQEVKVGVLGESEMLTLLGIPSFLILPGFLMLVTISQLWNCGIFKSPEQAGEFPLQVDKPGFWVVSITISGIMAVLYPLFTKRNYLDSYGLKDIAVVWCVSILLGLVTYIAIYAARKWYLWTEQDDPLTTLNKLHIRGLNPFRERVSLDGKSPYGYLLEPYIKAQGKSWVAPRIVVRWVNTGDQEERDQIKQEIDKQLKLEQKGSAGELAKLLEQGEKRMLLKIRWEHIDWLPHPQQVAELKQISSRNTILDFEED